MALQDRRERLPLPPPLLVAARPDREPERLRGDRGDRPGPSRQRDELIGIEDALASMPEQQRRAILLREWQGLSYREISEELELSQSAVETLIFRARRSLAQGLEQPELVKKPRRKGFRRALHMVDLGTIAAAAKTLLAGSAAAKATVAAVAVTAAAGAASVTPKLEGHSPRPAAPPARVAAGSRPGRRRGRGRCRPPGSEGRRARGHPSPPRRARPAPTRGHAGAPASIPVAAAVPRADPRRRRAVEDAPRAAPADRCGRPRRRPHPCLPRSTGRSTSSRPRSRPPHGPVRPTTPRPSRVARTV